MTEEASTLDARLLTSWEANADAWTTAVREQRIPSRRAGTDAAILSACVRVPAARVLDVGCGEGWLARGLAHAGRDVVGMDGSAALVARAEATNPEPARIRFHAVEYAHLVTSPEILSGPWELIVCNFALLGDPLAPLLGALAQRLAPGGRLLIQTVHPWMAVGTSAYADGWREETFDGFGVAFPASMPWFFRTLGSWSEQLLTAGLRIRSLEEPMHPESARPLSLILHAERSEAVGP